MENWWLCTPAVKVLVKNQDPLLGWAWGKEKVVFLWGGKLPLALTFWNSGLLCPLPASTFLTEYTWMHRKNSDWFHATPLRKGTPQTSQYNWPGHWMVAAVSCVLCWDSWSPVERISIRGQRWGFTTWSFLCSNLLLKYNRHKESFWHRHQKGTEGVPPC